MRQSAMPLIDVFINLAVKANGEREEGSRCLQLRARLRGGVDGGGAC